MDDPLIEEALEDFASDNDDDANEDKDSDFMVEGEEESGSDWEKSSSQKQKVSLLCGLRAICMFFVAYCLFHENGFFSHTASRQIGTDFLTNGNK